MAERPPNCTRTTGHAPAAPGRLPPWLPPWLPPCDMGARIAAFDWSTTPLGPLAGWPESLRTAVAICLSSKVPMAIYWGPDLTCLYNDAERAALGDLHPRALGLAAHLLLEGSWSIVGPQLKSVIETDRATWAEDQELIFDRYGTPEIGYFTYSYSPLPGPDGRTEGVLLVTQETTSRLLGERRTQTLAEFGSALRGASSEEEMGQLAARVLAGNADVPFASIYLLSGERAELLTPDVGFSGLHSVALRPDVPHPVSTVFARLARGPGSGVVMDRAPMRWQASEQGPDTDTAFACALRGGPADEVVGFLVVGIESRLRFDTPYRDFLELLGLHVGRTIVAVRARAAEKQHVQAMAELDRAKSVLFSNASHEFRTPIALILGNLEVVRAEPDLPAPAGPPLDVARRSALRMLKLANALLEFSRIEAGTRVGAFRPTNMAELTASLSSMFTVIAEQAGLSLQVESTMPCGEVVYLDHDAWEAIVSNLLGNAIKFTRSGTISVTTRAERTDAVLTVSDTGIGISADMIEHVFERFVRAGDAQALTAEGSGIGLALVDEYVRLHGGTVEVRSAPGSGARFVVRIPRGREHLTDDVVADEPGHEEPAASSVEEASGWGPDLPSQRSGPPPVAGALPSPASADPVRRPRLVVADDDRDMRTYLSGLLIPQFDVQTASNGDEALALVASAVPDAVISDVMMPGMDGFALVRSLRADPVTRSVPVMLLTARADTGSSVEGLRFGADEYLVKPFRSREFVARVGALVELSRLRREAAEFHGRLLERADKEESLRGLLGELRAAQRRTLVAGDAERRRIERDLHDGAQQRLVAIQLELGLLAEQLDHDPVAAHTALDRLRGDLDGALVELRELAHGLYPPLLISDGLVAALIAATRRTALPTTVQAADIGPLPPPVGAAVYFCCLEALQNAAKHAGTGSRAHVEIDLEAGTLRFRVTDDGVGFDPSRTSRGHGLVNLQDRMSTLGGRATVDSVPGRGTTVSGSVPLDEHAGAPSQRE
jgi:signal transduction histidine kinase